MGELTENKKPLHFVQLDALRFLAAFMVVFVHAFDGWVGWFGKPKALALSDGKNWNWFGHYLNEFIGNFNFGVDLFFLISGFLITYLLIKEKSERGKVNIPSFFLRRILRIWPLYFFIIILCYFFIVPWMGIKSPEYLPVLFFYNNFRTITTHAWDFPFSHFWSICIEEHFYLVWPFLVAFVSQKRLPVVLVAIIIGSIAFRGYAFFNMGESWFTLYLNTFSRIDALALGGLGAWAHFNKPFSLRMPTSVRLLIFGVLIWTLCVDDINAWDNIFMACWKKYIYCGLAGLLMMNYVFNPEAKFRWGPINIFNYLGRCCFGIYLWGNILLQIIIMKIFLAPNKPITDWLINHLGFGITYWFIVLGFSIAVPVISYELIEKPFMKLKSRFAIVKTRV